MTTFNYEAITASGGRERGHIQASGRSDALRALQNRSLQPVSLKEQGSSSAMENQAGSEAELPTGPVVLKKTEIIYFTEEVADLLDAGLQLDPALHIMEKRLRKSALTQAVSNMRRMICDGKPFSLALRSVSKSFGELYCSMVAAGELSGTLPQILKRQAGYLITINELRNRIVQALIYPSFIFVAGFILLFVFMSVLVPQLSVLFEKTGRSLPIPTRLLIGLSNIVLGYWWAILIAIAAGSLGFNRFIATARGRQWWDRAQLHIPLVGPILQCRFFAQFAQTLATLSANGVPLLTGLELFARSIGNVYLRSSLSRVVESVGEGKALSRALAQVDLFPPLVTDLVAVGEQTGDLSHAFRKIGARYDGELNVKIKRLTAFIQPVIVLIMALLVGVMAYSILAGIFQAVAGLRANP